MNSEPLEFLFQVWDFNKFQECLSEEHGLPSDWVAGQLTVRDALSALPLR